MRPSVFSGEALPLYDSGSFEAAEPVSGASPQVDPTELRRIVTEHHGFVWRSLLRLGVPRADVDDAVQQVFLVVARRLSDISEGAERSFLYGVSLRVASRTRRTQARRREVADGVEVERADGSARPDELLDRARARAMLDTILESMPLELRSVFTLFELEQLTMAEIAELLGVPQGTVASRLRRARETFTEQRKRMEARMRSEHAARQAGHRASACAAPVGGKKAGR
jgi:RNA polymerase sigma-70 factor (ECF subfamily)